LGSGTGSGGEETLCYNDFLVPVKVSALNRFFAIMISWVLVKGPALKRPFAIMISAVPVHRFRR